MNTIRWKMPDQYLTEWYRESFGSGKDSFLCCFCSRACSSFVSVHQ